MNAVAQFQAQSQVESKDSADALLWSLAMDACPESIALIEGREVLHANQAFAHLFGYPPTEDLRGRSLDDFIPHDFFPAATIHQSYPAREFSRPSPENTGALLHFEASGSALTLRNRNLIVISIHDISQRKRIDHRLREAEKMAAVGSLLGGVVHDFNNLLTGIMLYCDLLIAGLPDSLGAAAHPLRRYAEEIHLTGEHGAALTQQLLSVAQQQVVEVRELSWNDAISSTRNLLTRLLPEDIELITALPEKFGRVKLDSAQARQVILNLVLNARDSMSDGGRITLKTRNCVASLPDPATARLKRTACVELTVTDSGCGMDAETLAHAFDPFFTTKKSGEGNGLGLATVRDIAHQNGGTVQLESQPGKGTRVIVTLPRVAEDPETIPAPRIRGRKSRAQTILLVEDNPAVRASASQVLATCGYTLLQAQSGFEALRISRRHKGSIDLLITDIHLPGMNGREAASQMRILRPDLRLLYVSGYDYEDNPAGDADSDPIVVFRKPFTASALIEKVREVLHPEVKRGKSK